MILICALAPTAQATSNSPTHATQPNLTAKMDWPPPVMDSDNHSLILFELLEYSAAGGKSSMDWDMQGWFGGDRNRLWFKTEGNQQTSSPAGGDADLQLLYGRMISAYFDAQIGARAEQRWGNGPDDSRFSGVIAIEGLSLYMFELEAAIFIADAGQLSGRFTASQDYFFSQRAIAQIRVESNAAAKESQVFEQSSGINDVSLGLRLRYELKREFAPYVGVNWTNYFAGRADLAKISGEETAPLSAVMGLRMWY